MGLVPPQDRVGLKGATHGRVEDAPESEMCPMIERLCHKLIDNTGKTG